MQKLFRHSGCSHRASMTLGVNSRALKQPAETVEESWKQIAALRHHLVMNDDPHNMTPSPAEQVQLLFVRHEGAIRAFVRALLPTLADADDVLQETFLTVSRKAASFEPGTNFLGWACGIARLKVLEHFRQKKRMNVLSEEAINALADDAPAGDLMASREEALSRCVEKLAPRSRELMWRRYSGRQDSDEMATGLGMTSTAVRVALSKARAFLRDCVAAELQKG